MCKLATWKLAGASDALQLPCTYDEKAAIQSTREVRLYFLASSLLSHTMLSWASLRASGRKSVRSTYFSCWIVLRCWGIGRKPDTGSTRSTALSFIPPVCEVEADSLCWVVLGLWPHPWPAVSGSAMPGLRPLTECPLYLNRANKWVQMRTVWFQAVISCEYDKEWYPSLITRYTQIARFKPSCRQETRTQK